MLLGLLVKLLRTDVLIVAISIINKARYINNCLDVVNILFSIDGCVSQDRGCEARRSSAS